MPVLDGSKQLIVPVDQYSRIAQSSAILFLNYFLIKHFSCLQVVLF